MSWQTRKDNNWKAAAVAALALLLLAGCAARPVEPPPRSVEVVAAAPNTGMPSAGLIKTLAAAEAAVAASPFRDLRTRRWRQRLRRAEQQALEGSESEALAEAQAVWAEIDRQSTAHYRQHARQYLDMAERRTRLNDDQYARLRASLYHWHREEYRQAYQISRRLARELFTAVGWVLIHSGDTLAGIAGRREVYDNPRLWPLLRFANPGLTRDPENLEAGWRLRVPVHPTVDEVFAAVQIAQGR